MSFGQVFPDRLAACYAALITIGVDSIRDFGSSQFGSIKALLDDAQPKSQEENKARATIQFLYKQNPSSFYKFLIHNKLGCLVLWTEARCIVRHLGLRGVVYIKWNGAQGYTVLPHRKAAARQTTEEAPHSAVDRIERKILCRITMPNEPLAPEPPDPPILPDEHPEAPEPPVFSLKESEAEPEPPVALPTWASRVATKVD